MSSYSDLPEGAKVLEPSWGDYAADAIKAAPGALQRGGANLLGVGGDMRELAQSGLEWAGVSPESAERVTNRTAASLPVFGGPTSDQINRAADSATGGLPRAKHAPGQYLETGLEMAPTLVAGGSGPVRALGTGLLTHGSGEAAKSIDPRLEAPAEILTAVVAGSRGGKRLPKYRGGDTAADLSKEASDAYSTLTGAQVTPRTALSAKTAVTRALADAGYKPRWHSGLKDWLGKLDSVVDDVAGKRTLQARINNPKAKPPVDFDDFKELRGGQLESIFKSGTRNERRLAKVAQDALDDALESGAEFKGLPNAAKNAVFKAKKLETLAGVRQAVTERANYANTSDFGKALKREMQKVSRQINRDTSSGRRLKSQFTPEQIKVIRRVAEGKDIPDLAKVLRNYSPSNPVAGPQSTTVGILWSLLEANPIPAAVVLGTQGAGAATKALSSARARGNLAQLEALGSGAQKVPLTSRAAQRAALPAASGWAASRLEHEQPQQQYSDLPPGAVLLGDQ